MVALVAVVALGSTACAGDSTPGEAHSQGDIGGLPVTHFDSGLTDAAPEPALDVDNATSDDVDTLATAANADVIDYWTESLPANFDMQFAPLDRIVSYDSTSDDGIEICGQSVQGQVNAFYCPQEDTIAWDRGQLLPLLEDQFGDLGIVTVIAHEYGHAVQQRLGEKAGITEHTPTVVSELQADCFTGNYYHWAADGGSDYFAVSTSEGVNQALSALHFVRDAPGDLRQDLNAHGTGFDRTHAFQLGFENDPTECADIDERTVDEISTQQRFSDQDTRGGDLPITEESLALTKESLDTMFHDMFDDLGAESPDIVTGNGRCRDGSGTPPASYCPGTNTIAVDLGELADMAEPIDRQAQWDGREIDGFGDFAAFAAVASRYAMALQHAETRPLSELDSALACACLVGAWAGTSNEPRPEDRIIRLSPGDLDEAILEMLQPDSLIASTVDGVAVPGGFARVEALRLGYIEGRASCAERYR